MYVNRPRLTPDGIHHHEGTREEANTVFMLRAEHVLKTSPLTINVFRLFVVVVVFQIRPLHYLGPSKVFVLNIIQLKSELRILQTHVKRPLTYLKHMILYKSFHTR